MATLREVLPHLHFEVKDHKLLDKELTAIQMQRIERIKELASKTIERLFKEDG